MCRCNKCKRKRNLSGTADKLPGSPATAIGGDGMPASRWAWVGGAASAVGKFLSNDDTWKVVNNGIDLYTRLDSGGAQYNPATGQVSPIWNFTPKSSNSGGGGGSVKAGFDTNETMMMVGAAAVVVYLMVRK